MMSEKSIRHFKTGLTKSAIKHQKILSTMMAHILMPRKSFLLNHTRDIIYQAKSSDNFYFKDLESRISFIDLPSSSVISNEIVYIRNMTGSFDKEAYTGTIDTNHWLLRSDFSMELWNLLFLKPKELILFITQDLKIVKEIDLDPRTFIQQVKEFKSVPLSKLEIEESEIHRCISILEDTNINERLKQFFPSLQKSFSDINYIENDKLNLQALYCSALYLKLVRLKELGVEIPTNIKGFSVAGLTPKDFMSCFTRGKKKVYGNPYLKKERIKGCGEIVSALKKASGQLEITINTDLERAKELKTMIENAGVSAFYLGKKGLAYLSSIDIRPEDV